VTGRLILLPLGPAKTANWIALLSGDSGPCLLADPINETLQNYPNVIPPVVMYNSFVDTKWQASWSTPAAECTELTANTAKGPESTSDIPIMSSRYIIPIITLII